MHAEPSLTAPAKALSANWPLAMRLGEGILWDDTLACWWWTDILGQTLWQACPGQAAVARPLPEALCCLALTSEPGQLLLGLASGLALYDTHTTTLGPVLPVQAEAPGTRLNDGRCDRHGALVFGTMDRAARMPNGRYLRLNAQGRLQHLALPPVTIANSTCFSLDGRTLYFADSPKACIMACDYEPATGATGVPTVWATLREEDGVPDGACIDAEGCLWSACWGGSKVIRYLPDGRIDREVHLPVSQPSCVAIGGPDGRTMAITSARVDLDAVQLEHEPLAGTVFTLTLDRPLAVSESRWQGKEVHR